MSPVKDYIPAPDSEAVIWMRNYAAFTISNGASNGLTGPYNTLPTQMNSAYTAFDASLRALAAAEAALRAAVQAKNAARADAVRLVRQTRGIMLPQLDAAERASAGLTVPDASPTPRSAPVTRPLARIDASTPLRHTLRFADSATPTRRAKPQGVRHAEIWIKIGEPKPASHTEMRFAGIATRAAFQPTFDGADAGKTAHYLLRWVSTRNQPGPWSEVHSATIGGI